MRKILFFIDVTLNVLNDVHCELTEHLFPRADSIPTARINGTFRIYDADYIITVRQITGNG